MRPTALLLSLLACGARTRSDVVAAYKPLRVHQELFNAKEGWQKWIHPPLLEAIAQLKADGNATALRALLRDEVEGHVYSFQLMSDEFCKLFLEELDGFYASGLPIDRPNSMNNYGIIVNNIGMQPVISHLQRTLLQPLASLLYPTQAASGFDGHHSFMVQYKAKQDLGLDMHTDDSDGECRTYMWKKMRFKSSCCAVPIRYSPRTALDRLIHFSHAVDRLSTDPHSLISHLQRVPRAQLFGSRSNDLRRFAPANAPPVLSLLRARRRPLLGAPWLAQARRRRHSRGRAKQFNHMEPEYTKWRT